MTPHSLHDQYNRVCETLEVIYQEISDLGDIFSTTSAQENRISSLKHKAKRLEKEKGKIQESIDKLFTNLPLFLNPNA